MRNHKNLKRYIDPCLYLSIGMAEFVQMVVDVLRFNMCVIAKVGSLFRLVLKLRALF